MTPNGYLFHYFIIDIFGNWAYRVWYMFDNKITRTESTKPKLRVIGFYSIRSKDTIHMFSRLACVFALIEERRVLKQY